MLPAIDSAKPAPTVIAHRLQPTGALREDALYIERSADQELFTALTTGEFCYVLAPRQIGKSSLRARTARRLKRAGTHCAEIDLTSLGKSADRDPVGTWYFSLANRIADDLALDDPKPFFESLAALLPVERFGQYLRRQVLPQVAGTIVIFLDEIDYVRALPTDCDEFFVALRALYNERPQHPDLERLTFCLLGVAAPRDLVRDPHITPFNIGQPIRLLDFRRDELAALAPVLAVLGADPAGWLDEIYAWTAGHPYMTQVLCQELVKGRGPQAQGTAAERVGRAVSMRFLRSGRSVDENLSYAEKRLEQSPHKAELLILYRRLLADVRVPLDTGDAIQQELMMCGLAALRDASDSQPLLQVRNRVFARVFDAAWVQEKEAQRLLTTAYRRWHEAGGRDVDLLIAEDLALAQTWAQEHPREVSSQEHEFLLRCVDLARRKAEQDKRLSESNLAHERLRSAEQSTRTQRRIIFGLVLSLLLMAGLSLALYLQYRRAQAAAAAESRAAAAAAEAANAAASAAEREARAASKAQELVQAEIIARRQIEALAAAKQQEWARAEAQQKEASAAKAIAEQKIHELDEQIRKTTEARADLDESRRQNDSVSAARLAMLPKHRLSALVLGMRAVLPDIKSQQIHPGRWEGLTTAAVPLVGSRELPIHPRSLVICSAISRDAQLVAVGLEDGMVELYGSASSKPIWQKKAHNRPVWHLSFSDDMRHIASSGMDGHIRVINTDSGNMVTNRSGMGQYTHADFDRNNELKFTLFLNPVEKSSSDITKDGVPLTYTARSNNSDVPYFDRERMEIRIGNRAISTANNVFHVSSSRDTRFLAGSFGEPASTSVLDGHFGHRLWDLSSQLSTGLHFTADGTQILAYPPFGGPLRIWNLTQVIGESWQSPKGYVGKNINKLSSTGMYLIGEDSENEGELTVLNLQNPKAPARKLSLQRLSGIDVISISGTRSWAQDDKLIWNEIIAHSGNILYIWRVSDGLLMYTATRSVNGRIVVSGSGEYFFVSNDFVIQRHAVATGMLVNEWKHSFRASPHSFMVDFQGEKVALYISEEKELYVLNANNGSRVASFKVEAANFMFSVDNAQFTRSGHILTASYGRDLFIFDLTTQRVRPLSGHLGSVTSFDIAPDERLIASAADDKTVRLWQVDTGKQWLVVPVDEPVQQLRFVDGGTKILVLQKNGVVRTFPVDHIAYFRHGCRVLRGYSSITGVSEADRKEALSACPPDGAEGHQ